FIRSLNNHKHIKAFFVYELYDQPHLVNADWAGSHEAHYGIVGWKSDPPDYTDFYYKPVSETLKFKIEEINHGYEDYIFSILLDFYKEEPSEQDFRYWTSRLEVLKSKELVVKEILEDNYPEIFQELIKPHT